MSCRGSFTTSPVGSKVLLIGISSCWWLLIEAANVVTYDLLMPWKEAVWLQTSPTMLEACKHRKQTHLPRGLDSIMELIFMGTTLIRMMLQFQLPSANLYWDQERVINNRANAWLLLRRIWSRWVQNCVIREPRSYKGWIFSLILGGSREIMKRVKSSAQTKTSTFV